MSQEAHRALIVNQSSIAKQIDEIKSAAAKAINDLKAAQEKFLNDMESLHGSFDSKSNELISQSVKMLCADLNDRIKAIKQTEEKDIAALELTLAETNKKIYYNSVVKSVLDRINAREHDIELGMALAILVHLSLSKTKKNDTDNLRKLLHKIASKHNVVTPILFEEAIITSARDFLSNMLYDVEYNISFAKSHTLPLPLTDTSIYHSHHVTENFADVSEKNSMNDWDPDVL
jgi:hypothetical protein